MSKFVLVRRLFSATLIILLAGCSSVARMPSPVVDRGSAAPPDTRVTDYGRPAPGADWETDQEAGQASVAPSTQEPAVIVALLEHAETQANDGDLSASVATLERALRIEPRNPLLWHHLASVRLAQGEYSQAEQVAMKSNSMAIGSRKLQIKNWRLIAQAREQQGDTAGASQAERRARSLENY